MNTKTRPTQLPNPFGKRQEGADAGEMSNARKDGLRLVLKFAGEESPVLDEVKFRPRESAAFKILTLNRGENSFRWDKFPQAFSLFFLGYLIAAKAEPGKPFRFAGKRRKSAAATLGDGILQTTTSFHKLFEGDLHTVFDGDNCHGKLNRDRRIWLRHSDYLPAECVEVIWEPRGKQPLAEVADLRTLSGRIVRQPKWTKLTFEPPSQPPVVATVQPPAPLPQGGEAAAVPKSLSADLGAKLTGLPESRVPSVIPKYLPERNPHFRGRKADLAHLREALDQSATIGITQQVALFSSGGVGKSSLALEFGWDRLDSVPTKFPGGVFWCDCRGREVVSLADGLAALAEPLGIDAGESGDPFASACKVRDRLASGPPSLLILDNVLDSEQWKDKEWAALLPAGSCRRLLTTRAEDLGDHRIPMVRLDRLSNPDARALLQAYRDDVPLAERDDAVKEIIHWFGGLAIGLTVVGIYLRIHSRITWDAYWKSLCEKKLDAVRVTEDLASPGDYAYRVDAVIDDLFRSQSYAERRALLYASILPGEDVSDRWLIELLADDIDAHKITGDTPPGYASFPPALVDRLIDRRIFLRLIDSRTRKTVFLHQVVRERFRELLQQDSYLSRYLGSHVRRFFSRLYHRSGQWTRAITESANFSEAQEILSSMGEANCDPDPFTFAALIAKAGTYVEAQTVVTQMEAAGMKPAMSILNRLLSKAVTFGEANAVVAKIAAAGYTPTRQAFYYAISKATTDDEILAVVTRMQAAGVDPEVASCRLLLPRTMSVVEMAAIAMKVQAAMRQLGMEFDTKELSKAGSYPDATIIFEQLQKAGAKPSAATFKILVRKVQTLDDAKDLLYRMEKADVTPSPQIFNAILRRLKCPDESKDILDRMKKVDVLLSPRTFNAILTGVKSHDESMDILGRMKNASVTPDRATFHLLLTKAERLDQINAILGEMEKADVPLSPGTFNTILTRVKGMSGDLESNDILDRVMNAGVTPDLAAFNLLLSKAGSSEQAKTIFDKMEGASIAPDLCTFTWLLQKAGNISEGKAFLDRMQKAEVTPGAGIFILLLAKDGSYEEAHAVFDQIQIMGATPDFDAFDALLSKAKGDNEALAVLDQMQDVGAAFTVCTLIVLIPKPRTFKAAKTVFDQIQRIGAMPDIDAFVALLSKAESDEDVWTVLDQMQKVGVIPDPRILAMVREKAGGDAAKTVLDQMQKAAPPPHVATLTKRAWKKAGHEALARAKRDARLRAKAAHRREDE